MYADKEYLLSIRRELHEYPEIGFELPKTLALVRRELEKIGVIYVDFIYKIFHLAVFRLQKGENLL